MTDFLGMLIQRSLPSSNLSEVHAELVPRLPSLFEPTGGEMTAPKNTEISKELPFSTAQQNLQNMQGPHPSVMPQARISSLNGESLRQPTPRRTSAFNEADDSDRQTSTSPLQPSSVQPKVIRHESEHSPTANENSLKTLASARLAPVVCTDSPPNRQSQRHENTMAMLDGSSQTTVRINIGRIEVQAVQPAQPASPARRSIPQAKMTLDEYAKQRGMKGNNE